MVKNEGGFFSNVCEPGMRVIADKKVWNFDLDLRRHIEMIEIPPFFFNRQNYRFQSAFIGPVSSVLENQIQESDLFNQREKYSVLIYQESLNSDKSLNYLIPWRMKIVACHGINVYPKINQVGSAFFLLCLLPLLDHGLTFHLGSKKGIKKWYKVLRCDRGQGQRRGPLSKGPLLHGFYTKFKTEFPLFYSHS